MKKKLCFIMNIKQGKIYDEKFSFKNLKKKFNIKLFYIRNPAKNGKISQEKFNKLIFLVKKFNPHYIFVIASFQKEKDLIFEAFNNMENIRLVDFQMAPFFGVQDLKSVSKIFYLNLFNFSKKNFVFAVLLLLKVFWIILKKIRYQKKIKFKLDYFFYSGSEGKNYNQFYNSKISYNVPSFDILRLNRLKKISLPKNKYVLFHDQMLLNHPDYKILNKKSPEDTSYYKKLNNFFYFLEKKFDYEIIISLHPRANLKKSKRLYNGRVCKLLHPAELVKNSEFSCLHASTTSISFPIFFKKKILLLTSNKILKNFNFRYRLEVLNNSLNLINLNIDDEKKYEDKLKEFMNTRVNNSKYHIYKRSFLGPNTKKYKYFSDICVDKLQ